MKFRDVEQTGSLGETVSYKNRYGLIRRRKVIPRNPRTSLQVDRRAAFQRARAFWGTLTDEQMLAWDRVAKDHRTRTVLGESGALSGYELSVKLNVRVAVLGLPMMATPIPAPDFPANPASRLIAEDTDGTVSLKLQVTAQPVEYVLVFGARPQTPGTRYVCDYVLLGVLPDADADLCDITDLFVAKYGPPPAGKRIFIQTLQQINGWQDLPRTFNTRIRAP